MTIENTLAERQKTHGDFMNHASVTQRLKRVLNVECSNKSLTDVQREALEMIMHKIGRILSGNPNHVDHWPPLEPSWRGRLTIELTNNTPHYLRVYVGEGIAQVLFFRGNRPKRTYAEKSGIYMNQTDVTLPRVKL